MKATSNRKHAMLARLRRQAESGAGGVTFQVIGYVYLLVMLLGLVYDFGAVIFTQTVLKSAVVVASQELARNVDRAYFLNSQEIRLEAAEVTLAAAQTAANNVVGDSATMSPAPVTITSVSIDAGPFIDKVIVEGTSTARLPVLNTLLGIPPITIRAQAIAAPEFGINEINQ